MKIIVIYCIYIRYYSILYIIFMSKNIITYKLIILGKVQGVGYRYWFYKLAKSKNINGYVKNTKDHKVISIIQGSEKKILDMIELSKKGPINSNVENIRIKKL